MLYRLLLILAGVGLLAGNAAPVPAPVPIASFFRDAEITQPTISSDGARVVFLVRNHPARKSVALFEMGSKRGSIVFVPNDYNVDFAFIKGDRIVFGGDAGGNESYALRSVKLDGSSLRDLSESVDQYRRVRGPVGGNVYSTLPDEARQILVAGYGTQRNASGEMQWSGGFGFYRLDVGSGLRNSVENWDKDATSYFVDNRSGRIFGRTLQSGGSQTLEVKNLKGEYRRVAQFTGSEVPWSFMGLLPGERDALLKVRSSAEHDRGALYAFSRETMQRGRLLYEPPDGEITEIKRGADGKILSITRETDKSITEAFDQLRASHLSSLRKTFPDQQVDIVSSSKDSTVHVVLVHSDRDPGTYYLFETITPVITPIGRVNALIDPAQMADRTPLQFRARDGLNLHGYLTRPRTNNIAPLIVLPHGGPFGIRDSWQFDAEAQFLANRGYAVLQVNYRGSGGYGATFEAAGKRQWGRAMQNDLTDAVHWAIAQGITTADLVGIYGASYGGYAVMAGLTFTPELYRCGANYVGVADLNILRRPNRGTSAAYDLWFNEWIGDSETDLRAQSPAQHVQAIRVPSLHAYGENDPRVDIAQWKVLERELKRHNKPYVFTRERDEGHGFENELSRVKFYTELEEFLRKNLGPEFAVKLGETKTIELPASANPR